MADIAELGFEISSAPIEKAESSLDKLSAAAKKTETATEKMNREADNASKKMQSMSGSSGTLTATMTRMAGAITAALSVQQIQQYADTWSDLSSRIKLSISPGENAADVMSRLSDIARMTYSSLESTAEGFARNSMTLRALGKDTQQQLDFTEALNNALVVSGAKGMVFESAQQAIGKAMAEGTLRGDELNNILNNGGRIAQLLADDLGVNVTQLRKLASEGKITGSVIYQSLIKNMEVLRKEAESMPATIGDAFTLIRNAILQSVGVFDQANGLSESLAGQLVKVADAIRDTDWTPYVNGLTLAAKLYAAYLVTANAVPVAVMLGSTAHKAYTAVLAAFTVQATAANVQMTLMQRTLLGLKGAVGVAAAAFAGWQIGSYLRDEFDVVKKAGIALMSGLHQAAIAVGGVFKVLGETMKFALTNPLSFAWGKIVDFMELVQGLGAGAAKALGFEGIAETIGRDLGRLRTTTEQEYRATLSGIVESTRTEMAGVSDVYAEMFADVGKGADEVGKKLEESTSKPVADIPKKLTTAEKAYAKFRGEIELSIQSSKRLAEAYLKSAEAVEEVQIQQKIEEEVLKRGVKNRTEITKLIRQQHAANKLLDLSKNIADMRKQNAELQGYGKALLAGGNATEAGRKALALYNDEREIEAALVGKTSAEIDKLIPKLRQEQQIRRDRTEHNAAIEEMNALIIETRTQQEKANAEFARLDELMKRASTPEQLEAIRRKIAEVKNETNIWAKATQGAIDRVDQVGADFWKSFLDGGKFSFSSLKDIAKQWAAEMLNMLTFKPLLTSFSNMLFGTNNSGGIGDVFGSLFGGSGGGGGGSGGGLSNLIGIGKNIYSLYSSITGVGAEILAGWQSGGIGGAVQGGAGYYGKLLTNAYSTISQWFGGTATAAASQAAASAATSAAAGASQAGYGAALSQWIAGGGAQAVAQSGAGAAAGGFSGAISSALGSLGSMWYIAPLIGMIQSGKLFDQGVRADEDALNKQFGGSGISQLYGKLVGGQANLNSKVDGLIATIVGDKAAAIITGSPVVQALASVIGKALGLGGGEQFKRTVGSASGVYSGGEYQGTGAVPTWFAGERQFGGDFDAGLHNINETFSKTLGALFDAFDIDSEIVTSAAGRLRRTSGALAAEFFATFEGQTIEVMGLYGKKGNIGDSMERFFDDVLGRGIKMAIEASSLPAYLKEVVRGAEGAEGVAQTITDLFTRFEGVNSVLGTLRLSTLTLNDAGLRSADSLLNLVSAIAGLEDPTAADKLNALSSLTSAYYDNFFTETEKQEDVIKAVTEQFKALGLTAPTTREAFREMVDGVYKTGAEGAQTFLTLMAMSEQTASYIDILAARSDAASQSLANTAAALQNLLMIGVDSSYSMLQRSISAERDRLTAEYQAAVAQQQAATQAQANAAAARANSLNDMAATSQSVVTALQGLGNALDSAMDNLLGSSAEYVAIRREESMGVLRNALTQGRAGKSLSGFEGLQDALSNVSTIDSSFYSSLADFEREQGRTANLIAELQAINGKQLTAEEKLLAQLQAQASAAQSAAASLNSGVSGISSQLQKEYEAAIAALDKELENAQLQIDALNGIDNSILGVGVAIDRMNAAIVAAINGQATAAGGSQAVGSAATIDRLYQSILGYSANEEGQKFWQNALANGSYTLSDLVAGLRAQAGADALMKIPAFASGGNHMGGIRLVGENGPELEVTGRSRIYNAHDTASMMRGGDSSSEEIRALRREVAELNDSLFQIAKNTGDTNRSVRQQTTAIVMFESNGETA